MSLYLERTNANIPEYKGPVSQRKSNKRTKSLKISSLFFKRGNRNAQRTEKHKKKITPGET